jgi:hypothetical protein
MFLQKLKCQQARCKTIYTERHYSYKVLKSVKYILFINKMISGDILKSNLRKKYEITREGERDGKRLCYSLFILGGFEFLKRSEAVMGEC